MTDLCVVIPAYNEAAAIAETVRGYRAAFPGAPIIVIDNNSTDRTAELAAEALRGSPGRVISERRQGKGFAVKTGLSAAEADIYVLTDGDNTYRAADARKLVDEMLKQRFDMAVGDRVSSGAYAQQNERAGHSVGNAMLTRIVSGLSGRTYRDVLSGLRVMSRPFVAQLDVRSEGFQLETELNVLAAHLRADVVEIPIDYDARGEGSVSKLNTVRDGIRILWFALSRWIGFFPLQAFSLVAAGTMLVAGVLGYRVFAAFIASGGQVMQYPSSAVAAAALGLVAVQSLFTGLTLRIIGRNQRRRDIADFLESKRTWNGRLDGARGADAERGALAGRR